MFFKELAMKRNVSRYIGFYCQCGNMTYYGSNLTEKGILQFKTAIYDAYFLTINSISSYDIVSLYLFLKYKYILYI